MCDNNVCFSLSVPGKIILIGEHSVLYNKKGIAVSIDQRTNLVFQERKQAHHQLTVNFTDLNNTTVWDFKLVYDFINRDKPLIQELSEFSIAQPELLNHDEYVSLIQEFIESKTEKLDGKVKSALVGLFYIIGSVLWCSNVDLCPFDIQVSSDLSIGAGTGSSAAFSVSISAAIFYYLKLKATTREDGQDYNICNARFKPYLIKAKQTNELTKEDLNIINKWAYCIEKIMHGKPSGLDNTVCTFGSATLINANVKGTELSSNQPDFQPFQDLPDMRILLINTGVERKTSDLAKKVSDLRNLLPVVIDSVLTSLDIVADNFISVFKEIKQAELSQQDIVQLYNKLESLVDISQGLLVTLGVSHPRLDEICHITKLKGLHSKLTGAGGGGNAFTIIPPHIDETLLDSVISDLKASGFSVKSLKIGSPGLTIDSNS